MINDLMRPSIKLEIIFNDHPTGTRHTMCTQTGGRFEIYFPLSTRFEASAPNMSIIQF